MLNIITGRTGSGKTRYIRSLAAQSAQEEKGKTVIIVPEQFSFETEKGMLSLLGNEKINNVEILSFSRLAERLLTDYGRLDKKIADDGTRAVLMSLAIETLEDKITVFNRYRKSPALISELLNFYRELKKCCIPVSQLQELSKKVKKATFSQKLAELSLIFDCYEALLNQKFSDDCMLFDMLYDLLGEVRPFAGKKVFVDAFSGFSAQEYKILERIISTADETYVTFCCDTQKNNGRYELFYNAQTEIKKLKAFAKRTGIKIAPEKILYSKREFKAEPLNVLEENLFSERGFVYGETADCISVMPCRTVAEECDSVAAEIKRLAREEGYRYRDIAVIERGGAYKNELLSSFRKYGIDYFEDDRQPVLNQPLMAFMTALFDLMIDGFGTETVLRFLKTGLYGFSALEIAAVEDYSFTWRINGSDWANEWTENPDGFGVDFTEENKKELEKLNALREKIVGPVLSLKNKITDTDGETVSAELFAFLRRAGIDENLKYFTNVLAEGGETDLSIEQGRIWRILADILDSLYSALGKTAVSVKRYRELFEILASSKDLGQIPGGIDEVIIGSADRMRAAAPKAVFIVGANTGVFPAECGGGVLLSDSERCELMQNGADIVSNLEYNSVSERFIAYHAMTLATEKLYISYSSIGGDSSALTPSELITEVKSIFPGCAVLKTDSLTRIESRRSAFTAYAKEKNSNSILEATLYKYFEESGSETELAMIEKIGKKHFALENGSTATELFGKNMYISASKTEKYYKCPFEYFCEFGIKAKPRREALMDPAQTGTLVHYALERFMRENPKGVFEKYSKSVVGEKTAAIIDEYVCEKLGGYSDKNSSFLRSVNLIKENTAGIVMQLVEEFANCRFVPVDFELSINNDGEIAPYFIELPDGGTVKIIGSVDRVDKYETDENTFIRVIDYKTGGKKFELGEVLSGLNMQMLIYLFAIWQNGGERYGNVIPAGILYFQAKNSRATRSNLTRYDDAQKVKAELQKSLKMSGMVLNNIDVINAMEQGGAGVYIPAKIAKDGNASGNVISLSSFEKLKNRVNKLVCDMAENLHKGEIDAVPAEDACKYCKYGDICKREDDDTVREIEKIGFADAINMLGDDVNEH